MTPILLTDSVKDIIGSMLDLDTEKLKIIITERDSQGRDVTLGVIHHDLEPGQLATVGGISKLVKNALIEFKKDYPDCDAIFVHNHPEALGSEWQERLSSGDLSLMKAWTREGLRNFGFISQDFFGFMKVDEKGDLVQRKVEQTVLAPGKAELMHERMHSLVKPYIMGKKTRKI